MQKFVLFLAFLTPTLGLGAVNSTATSESVPEVPSSLNGTTSLETKESTFYDTVKKHFGVTYFSFFNGPGLHPNTYLHSPNELGRPANFGINIQNEVSLRWKISPNFALDFQTRFYLIFTNPTEHEAYRTFRWEAPRIGISGVLLKGDDWSLTGAINTDFPYFFPEPFSGNQAKRRTVLFNPGLFAGYKWEPRNSRWSIFSVVRPRVFFYADRKAGDGQQTVGGYPAASKPELILAVLPTVNYRLTPSLKLSLGTTLDYRKSVQSGWNPFKTSLVTNGNSKAWVLQGVPLCMGVTYQVNDDMSIFPFITSYPIAKQRFDAKEHRQASFWETVSMGMWIRGTLF